ncbi:uncharacterized protein [Typha angustifolia]|uniref:uncharacterized protein n=1 Tax=Typha angustifolia TaxID=59011 RepID=UPI003C2CD603
MVTDLALQTLSPSLHASSPIRKSISSKSKSIHISSSANPKPHHKLQSHPSFTKPQPPWLLLPPTPRENPSSDLVSDFQLNGSASAVPFSLRFLQLRKKRMAAPRRPRLPSPDLGSLGYAVCSLASALESLQQSVVKEESSTDAGDSIVWLFKKVFASSPLLVVQILSLTTEFLATSALPLLPRPLDTGEFTCWSDIGILDDSDKAMYCDDYKRKRAAYEQIIVTEMASSLILANYAQLLYQYENDPDRADDYFSRAVAAEPVDGEAMSKYALFLWHQREDLEKAEEMFLEAIQAEPENSYHRSTYAWFLWRTGGVETCFPLEGEGCEE